jgi:hypothetical protein
MRAIVGYRIVVESERVAQPSRAGVIEEILQPDPPRYRVRWDDGHRSIISPTSGAARVEQGRGSAPGRRPRAAR